MSHVVTMVDAPNCRRSYPPTTRSRRGTGSCRRRPAAIEARCNSGPQVTSEPLPRRQRRPPTTRCGEGGSAEREFGSVVLGDIDPRGPDAGTAEPPEHRAGLRPRRARRCRSHRDGAGPRRDVRRSDRPSRAVAKDRLRLVAEAAAGLAYLHRCGHRRPRTSNRPTSSCPKRAWPRSPTSDS